MIQYVKIMQKEFQNMPLSAKLIRSQLNFFRSLVAGLSLDTIRKGQDKLGELMEAIHRKDVLVKEHAFPDFDGAWILPRDERRSGVIFYLHGGGYTCGDLEYAKGFGSRLAVECGSRVFCAAYRLAPEHPFPAALEDCLTAYRYLLEKGYPAGQITLCGESAGGGLCYALCLRLQELSLPLPAGIIGISPWTDLTASGKSYEENKDADPSMTKELLDFFAACYTVDRKNPLVSPLFADLAGMPPSLLFVGGDEIMLDDTRLLHEKLLNAGCRSKMIIAPERWHGYVLYGLQENEQDMATINHFLNKYVSPARKLRWLRLDNAAKIYPAALGRNWSNVFRLSATLTEDVDIPVLQRALDVTIRRFPSIAARLRRGLFWYYLEQIPQAPEIRTELSYPLARMPLRDIRKCAFRVIVYERRIAVEFFHALTDGNGGLIFLKSLVAEYLQQKYSVHIPAEKGVLGRLEDPSPEEMEDSFLKYAGDVPASRKDTTAWHFAGTPEKDGFINLTCFRLNVADVIEKAHSYGVSLTAFLCAAMLLALLELQQEVVLRRRSRKPVKVLIPVNLRRLFPSRTLRNFVYFTTPEIDPRLGDYSFQEICHIVHHHMAMDITPKIMSSKIATNVNDEKSPILKVVPLFLKNIVMKAVFLAVGECKSCLSLSNLGAVDLPEAMKEYVERIDFIIGPQARFPHNCGCLSYGDTLYINMIRKIRESSLEAHFFRVLQRQGLHVLVESNQP